MRQKDENLNPTRWVRFLFILCYLWGIESARRFPWKLSFRLLFSGRFALAVFCLHRRVDRFVRFLPAPCAVFFFFDSSLVPVFFAVVSSSPSLRASNERLSVLFSFIFLVAVFYLLCFCSLVFKTKARNLICVHALSGESHLVRVSFLSFSFSFSPLSLSPCFLFDKVSASANVPATNHANEDASTRYNYETFPENMIQARRTARSD